MGRRPCPFDPRSRKWRHAADRKDEKDLYTAANPGMYPYVDSTMFMYSHPNRTGEYFLGAFHDWEYALLP